MSAINVENATTTTCSASAPIGPQNRRQEETRLLTDHDVNKVLERKFRGGGGFRLVDWRLEPLEAKGFLGRYYQLRVTASRADDKKENLRFFMKVPPPDGDIMLEYLLKSDAFNKEIDIYTDLIRRMDRIGRSEWSVECYLCKRDVLIILEDVSINGYAVMDKYVPFDEEHCVLLLKSLARLHSRSLILEERLRREGGRSFLDLYGHLLKETFFIDEHDITMVTIAAGIKAIHAVVDLIRDELDEREKIAVKRRISEWMQRVPRLLTPSSVRRNVVCHRDVWANNIMFRHDLAGKPRSCYLVDFQFFCYAPPAIDFVLCLYLNTDRATRESRFDAYARIYYDLFARNLAEEGFDVEEYLPWAEFQESYTEARNIGLAYACNCLPVVLLSSEATKDYFYNANKAAEVMLGDGRRDLVLDQYRKMPTYKERILEIILEARDRFPEHPPWDL